MGTEQVFKAKFVNPLADCYGQSRLPAIRILKLWERLKAYPDHLYAQCAERIILNYDNFPGVQAILNTCAEVGGEFARLEAERLKAEVKCIRCRSQGVVLANNCAYKCTCQLGELLYPAFPVYQGQVHIQDKISIDEEGNRVFENQSHQTVVPKGCRDIRQIRTVVKDNVVILQKKEKASTEFRTPSLQDFPVGPA